MYKITIASIVAAFLAGCSTAGPFVTNISSDGAGGLTIDKCMVHHNAWTGMTSNSDCTSSSIRIWANQSPNK